MGTKLGNGLRNVPGYVAEVWQGERKVGAVFRWRLDGFNGAWKASASKSWFEPDFDQQRVEIRFFITAQTKRAIQFIGIGHVLNPHCDGTTHFEEVSMVGTDLRLEKASLEGGSSNGNETGGV